MLTRLSLRKSLELVGVDPRSFWGVQPMTPDKIFWPTLAEAPEGKPTRLEFLRAVEIAEEMIVGSDNVWVTSPTMEPVPGPKALKSGYHVATWGRRVVHLALSGQRKFVGYAELTPLNERVLVEWITPYNDFVQAENGRVPLLQEVRVSCPQCRESYNPFPILSYVGSTDVSLIVEPYEVIAPSVYVDVRGAVPPVQANWGTVEVWAYMGNEVPATAELVGTDATFVYSGVERPDIWLRLVAGYIPNVCSTSLLFRRWAEPLDPALSTPWGSTFGAYEARGLIATVRG